MLAGAVLLIAICCNPCSFDDNVDELIKLTDSEKRNVRIVAINELGRLIPNLESEDQKRVAEKIVGAVSDPASLVVSAAKMQMAQHPEIYNNFLGPFMKSKELRPFAQGCESIKAIGAPARIWLKQLGENLDNKVERFHLASLHALAHLQDQDLLPLLDKVIEKLDSKDFNIQLSACRVLAKIGPKANKAGPRLVRLLEDGIASSRSWASIALGAIGPHEDYDVVKLLDERLDRFYLIDRQRALEGLAYLGDHAKPTLPKVEKLMKDLSKSVPHTAARTHWKITGDAGKAIEVLVRLVPSMDFGVDSMDVLAEMGHEAKPAVPNLVKQLESPEAPTREAAIYALAAIGKGAKDAIGPLKKMDKDEDVLIRAAAEMAIGKIKQATEEQSQETETDSNE